MTDGHTQWSNAGGHPKAWDLSCVRKPTADLLGVFERIEKSVASIWVGSTYKIGDGVTGNRKQAYIFFKSSLIILMHPEPYFLPKTTPSPNLHNDPVRQYYSAYLQFK